MASMGDLLSPFWAEAAQVLASTAHSLALRRPWPLLQPSHLSEARAGSSWLAAGLLGCTPEWHEQAGLSPSPLRSLTVWSLLVGRRDRAERFISLSTSCSARRASR